MVPNRALQRSPTDVAEPYHRRDHAARAGKKETEVTRSILLWLIGVPIPIILLLALCTHHF